MDQVSTDREPAPFAGKPTVAGRLADVLCEQIVAGDLAPGRSLNLDQMRLAHGVSVSSMREAMTRLVALGLVRQEAQKGFAVAPMSAADLSEIDATARAFCPTGERLQETDLQGAAFCRTTAATWGNDLAQLTYPVAVGCAARQHDIPLDLTVQMYLHAFLANLIAAGQRLLALGQTDAQQRLSALSPQLRDTAGAALSCTLDDLFGASFAADIASMRHETQYSRIFRS